MGRRRAWRQDLLDEGWPRLERGRLAVRAASLDPAEREALHRGRPRRRGRGGGGDQQQGGGAMSASAWTPLAMRAGAYALGFTLLVLVGSGRLSRWLSPPAPVIATAEAATAQPAASASAAAPS